MKEKLNYALHNQNEIINVCKALSSPIRLQILNFLTQKPAIISDIAQEFDIPASSAALYVKNLEDAGLISTKVIPGSKGSQKLCGVVVDAVNIDFFKDNTRPNIDCVYTQSMPVGCYFDYKATPSCGMVSEAQDLGIEDSVAVFCSPNRFKAQLIWLSTGFLDYRFNNSYLFDHSINRIHFSFEICSEALGYENDWASDVTLSINGIRLGDMRCDGDYGGRPGRLNPKWWSSGSTQYGKLRELDITDNGSFLDNQAFSDISLKDLKLTDNPFIALKFEVRPDAKYVGGFNLFGEKFGDYPQNIVMEFYDKK
ncbi:ArsR/SmtB family transcription factor [Butyrivibrio sp. MC2013]|uniref:ArsR/SmtB family transcription factor n=1 Tax=Butyrivibrio sp. MC2013 TaxID=1280686 RepID=UPI00040DB690|nr:helix-turn-helix domain-containing protein [Butyrivibrio sp. MC2013]